MAEVAVMGAPTSVGTPVSTSALNLAWVLGINTGLLDSVHDLGGGRLFYAASHTGVIYDEATRAQTHFLQAHVNGISALATSPRARGVLFTADSGPRNALLVAWDARSGRALRTYFLADGEGVVSMAATDDERLVAAVITRQTEASGCVQVLRVYEWARAGVEPVLEQVLDTADIQKCIRFRPQRAGDADALELMSNGSSSVWFHVWQHGASGNDANGSYRRQQAQLRKEDVGLAQAPEFVSGSYAPVAGDERQPVRSVTATAHGELVVWEAHSLGALSEVWSDREPRRAAVRCIRLHKGALHWVGWHRGSGLLATCGADGAVRVFDAKFRIVTHFEELRHGSVGALSFFDDADEAAASAAVHVTLPFRLTYATEQALAATIAPGTHARATLFQYSAAPLVAAEAHPAERTFLTAGAGGRLQLWDYTRREFLHAVDLHADGARPAREAAVGSAKTASSPAEQVTCVKCSRNGQFVAAGTASGRIHLLSLQTLEALQDAAHERRACILQPRAVPVSALAFSADGAFLASAVNGGGDFAVTLSAYRDGGWHHVGSHRSHVAPVAELLWPQLEASAISATSKQQQYRLWSIGSEGRCVEYDVGGSSHAEGLKVLCAFELVQAPHAPLAALVLPRAPQAVPGPHQRESDVLTADSFLERDEFLLVATAARKTLYYNPHTLNCRRTVLSPAASVDLPTRQLLLVPRTAELKQRTRDIAFSTGDRVIGLSRVPQDGHPSGSACVIAHAAPVAGISATCDGAYLVSAGTSDHTAALWAIDADVVTRQLQTGDAEPSQLAAWEALLPGGRAGGWLKDVQDYMYYANLRRQGEETADARVVSDTIHIDDLVSVMRALGFYPTEREAESLLAEARFGDVQGRSEIRTTVDLATVVRLFVNHRPVKDLLQEDIERALAPCENRDKPGTYSTTLLLNMLQNYGEPLLQKEFAAICGKLLSGTSYNGEFPQEFTAGEFIARILSMGYDAQDEQALEQELLHGRESPEPKSATA